MGGSRMVFARAKIQLPRPRPELIKRGRLETQLGESMARDRLVLLCAPAGFGKTAALTRQLALSNEPAVAWLSADLDDHLARFAACLFAALEPFKLPWRVSPATLVEMLATRPSRHREVGAELLGALNATGVRRGLIIIDDAHKIEDRLIFEWIDQLLEGLPAHWGLVISSRVDPPLALAKRRSLGEMGEFCQNSLRFSEDEVRELLPLGQQFKASGMARQLMALTQGWAAGLRLAISVGIGAAGPHTGLGDPNDRRLFEDLVARVLDALPQELRSFLLHCSVLPELTVPHCMAVSGNPRAASLLDEIEHRGLFASVLDGAETTLRLHDLFRDCLVARLRGEVPVQLQLLLCRAAAAELNPERKLGFLRRAQA